MDTNTINPTVATAAKPLRVKHALSFAVCRGTEAGVKMLDSTADVIGAVATRVKLHNLATACDIVEEYPDQIKPAQELLKTL